MVNPALTIAVQIMLAVAVGAGIGLMTGPTIARYARKLRNRTRHADVIELARREEAR